MEGVVPAATWGPRSYTYFEPRTEWVEADESDTLLVDVAGFNKEQMQVQITTSGRLKISGERPLEGNQWIRFFKEYQVPKHSDPRGTKAKFDRDEGLLFVVLPKTDSGDKDDDAQRQRDVQKKKFAVWASNPKLLIASILMAVVVVMGIGIYFRYKLLRNSKRTDTN